VVIFWSDERYVETDNPYSNVRTAKNAYWIRQRFTASLAPFARANRLISPPEVRSTDPQFVYLHAGVLPDSIYSPRPWNYAHGISVSGSEALDATPDQIVASLCGLAPWVDRITFTPPLINNAHHSLSQRSRKQADVVAGAEQQWDHPIDHSLPITSVRPTNGTVHWIIDEAAASKLDRKTALKLSAAQAKTPPAFLRGGRQPHLHRDHLNTARRIKMD